MKKHHMLRTVLLSTVFALLTIVLLTPAASAHTAAPAHAAATPTSLVPDIPNVNIVIRHGKAVFSPTVVHCKANDLCFTLTNTTNEPQQLITQGHPSPILGPGVYIKLIVEPGVLSLSLKSNTHAHLTVISS